MTQTTTALATRQLSDTQIKARMELNRQSRFGLQDASPAQLNIVFVLAKRWGLDPVNELTLYEGRPFITLEGRQQLMRRHPDYRTFRTRPLSRDERDAWGYEPDDIVVECTVVTREHGEIVARGAVRRTEIDSARATATERGRRSAPVGIFGPEIAEARAIKRATRAAFGQDIPDESDLEGYEITPVEPERTKELAAAYDRIYTAHYDDAPDPAQSVEPPSADASEAAPVPPSPAGAASDTIVKSVRHQRYQELLGLADALAAGGLDSVPYRPTVPIALSEIERLIAEAQQAISEADGSSESLQAEF